MTRSPFTNKSILVTGGTGSFGSHFVKRLLEEDCCSKIIVLSRDEWKQSELKQSDPIYRSSKARFFLGDVRDVNRLRRAFEGVDYVVHAAALKQVPVAEYNPSEFVKTNILGAMNVIDAAIDCHVKKVIALSTDKAVNPINLYGATKLCSDKLFSGGNVYVGALRETKLSIVRYGNVFGSRGSLLPYWKKLIAEGVRTLPITDPRMTRFWITLDKAVNFVINSFSWMQGPYAGEIFVPKIPSMKIVDLARALAPDLTHEIVGIRPGEILHELMINKDDARHTLEFDDHYMIIPEMYAEEPALLKKFLAGRQGKTLPEDFSYTSDGNTQWLTAADLQAML